MLRGLILSVAQLTDPRILAVLLKSLVVTLAIFRRSRGRASTACSPSIDFCALSGEIWESCALPGWAQWLATIGGTRCCWSGCCFRRWRSASSPVLPIRSSPRSSASLSRSGRRRAIPLGIGGTLALGLGSSLRLLLWNLLALPFYILLLVTGVGPLILLFLAVNALVLGRDLANMVAVRHLDRTARRQWLAQNRGQRILLGGITTALFLLPIINLVAPVLGAAMATHLYHGRA